MILCEVGPDKLQGYPREVPTEALAAAAVSFALKEKARTEPSKGLENRRAKNSDKEQNQKRSLFRTNFRVKIFFRLLYR